MLLWDVLARSSAILVIAALMNAALRGRSAALRHAVWACGLAGALAVAPLSWILPSWHVPLLPALAPAPESTASVAAAADVVLEPASTVPELASRVTTRVLARGPSRVAERVPSRIAERVPTRIGARLASAGVLDAADDGRQPDGTSGTAPGTTPASAAGTTPRSQPAARLPWGALIVGVWALGTLLLLGRLGIANLVTFRALRTRATTSAPWVATARRLARLSGVPRTHFVRAESITMPMAAGYLRPTVALPAEADAWPDERVTSVLLHELAHVRRRDCLTQLAASTACALYWMNPLAWYAARGLRRERERACDDAVLAAGTAGPTYAEHLLDVARAARHVTTPTWSGGVAMAHRSELEGRLMAILDDARNRQSVSYGAAGVAGILCLALVAPLAALDPWALSVAEAQSTGVAVPPGAGPTPKAPKTPRPSVTPRPAAVEVGVAVPDAVADGIAVQAALAELPELVDETDAAIAVEPAVATATVSAVQRMAPVIATAVSVAHNAAFDFHVDTDFDEQTLPTPAPAPTPTPTPQATPNPPNPPAAAPRQPRPERARREPVPADPRVIAALGGALKDSDVEVRQQAAHSLGQMRDPAAVDALIPALQDADVEVRQNVVFALGQLRDVRAIPGLTVALKDANEEVRQRAAFALSQLRDPRAIDPLLIAAKDANPEVRRQALFAIGQIDASRGKDAAIEALKDKDAEVRRMAAHLLGRLAHERD
jgi:beta-lactamase regulating signal transducer with metallopeptidase domain